MTEESIDLESTRDGGCSDSNPKLYEIWNNLLQPDSRATPAEAAKQMNELFRVENEEKGDSSNAEGFLWNFWALLIQIAQLVPHDHSGQTKLSLTLAELCRLPPTEMEIWGARARVWIDLPLLSPCLRDNFNGPTPDEELPDKESAQRWINLNSFAARLLGKGLVPWTQFAIWQLRDALEEPILPGSAMNCNISAATEWIFQGGVEFFRQLTEDVSEDNTRMTEAGSLYQGKAGLCRARWDFWEMRFSEVSKQVDEDVGEQALRAAQEMRRLSGGEV